MAQSNLYKLPAKYWMGRIAIGYGIGYFEGAVGYNSPHRHHAHQLSFAKQQGERIQVIADDYCIWSSGVYIAANTLHHLQPGTYCSIYIDQTHFLADVIQHYLQAYLQPDSSITLLPESLVTILRACFIKKNKHLNLSKSF